MIQKSHDDRMLWAQFDALEMGTGWEDTDILKPQIMIESVYGDSHPGSYHLNQMVEQAVYGVYQCGGKPAKYYATDICDGCAQGHDGMNVVLASREAIANMVEVHASRRAATSPSRRTSRPQPAWTFRPSSCRAAPCAPVRI